MCDIIDRKTMSGEIRGGVGHEPFPLYSMGPDIMSSKAKFLLIGVSTRIRLTLEMGKNTVWHAEVSGRVHSSYVLKSKVLTISRQGSSALYGTCFSFRRTSVYCGRSCNM